MDARAAAEDGVIGLPTLGIAWLLAPAWGLLAAVPLVRRARRATARTRIRDLGTDGAEVRASGRWTEWIPDPVRSLVARFGIHRLRRRQADALRSELPLILDLLQVAVSAGATPFRALELAVQWGPPTGGDVLGTALGSIRLGSALSEALETTATGAPALAPVAEVLVATDRLGAPAGPALTRLAHEVRSDLRRRAEARARTLPVKLLFPLVFLVLPAFGLLTVVPALLTALSHT
jgi:Type II secretion system (T2SS), protein F